MRRDMHRWFIATVGLVHLAGFLAFSASQNPRLALTLLEALYALLLAWMLYVIHRRRAFRKVSRNTNHRSSELRCPSARSTRSHHFSSPSHAIAR